jgi:serine/threonine-protein kinase RsbW
MPKKTFPGQFENLENISDFVIQVAQQAGLDEEDVYAIQLAVDEAATNIIEHAYQGCGGKIECSCEVIPDGLKVVLVDHGIPFDPDLVPAPATNVSLEEVKPRGLGLFFMRRMMDDVYFQFTQNRGNVLTMVKRKNR